MKEHDPLNPTARLGMNLRLSSDRAAFHTHLLDAGGQCIHLASGDTIAGTFKNAEDFLASQFAIAREKLVGVPGASVEENWIDRLKAEKDELNEKITKLSEFMHGDKFMSLDLINQQLLSEQAVAMGRYHTALEKRLERAQA